MPQTDTIKLLSANITAMVLAIGGPILIVIVFLQATVPLQDRMVLIGVLGPFIGFAVNYLFQTNTTAAARGQTRTDILTPSPNA